MTTPAHVSSSSWLEIVRHRTDRRRIIAVLAAMAAVFWMIGPAHAQTPPAAVNPPAGTGRVAVVFSGGHETDERDRGRPVILVAGALGVPPEVFREAFTHVHPAGPGTGGPSPEQARDNKAALMSALGRYGITNDRLDTVSNYYRYVRSRGEMWPTRPATAYALVANGKVTAFVVTDGGAGYSSPPTVSVPGINGVAAGVSLAFGKEFEKNGSVAAITLTPPPPVGN